MILNHGIRLATIDDAPRIGAMSRDLIEHGLEWRWTPSSIRQCIRSASTNVAVAPTERGIAGFAVMQYKDDEAHLILLGVDPAHRRRGVASALVAAAEAHARDRGATVVETWTYHGSPLSLPFWTERMGYAERSVNLRKRL